jgi:DNA repair protein RadA/Sms
LLLKVLDNHIQVNSEQKCLYVSAEESSTQVAARAKRMDVNNSNIYLYCEESWQKIVTQVKSLNPSILVIDSIQTISSNEINSIAGSPSQVREITTELMKLVKKNDLSAFIIGHITKEGAIAGPKHLEHMVDVVCYFEKAQSKSYRLLRSKKNRFGTTDEVGIFEMNERGIKAIDEASHLRINERNEDPGKSYSCVIEGTRPLLVEVQALVVENKQSHVKRSVQGYDLNRLQMIIAVMEKYFGLSLSFFDIYINVVGISKSKDLDLDLAIVTAILSSINMQVIPNTTVVLGEIGLTGSTRASKEIEKKIISLKQFGYESAVCGTMNRSCTRSSSIDIIELSNIKDLKTYLEQSNGSKRIAG